MPETPDTKQPTPKRRWRPRFSLLTLVLGVLFVSACGGLWWRWEPWVRLYSVQDKFGVFSPDGRYILTAVSNSPIRVWARATGREIAAFNGHTDTALAAAFSPDGSRVVTGGLDCTARVWELDTGREIAVLKGHTDSVCSVAFSPDGQRVVAGSELAVRVWDVSTCSGRLVYERPAPKWCAVAFSPDGRLVAVADEDATHVLDAGTGTERMLLNGSTGSPTSIIFSPDGRYIVVLSRIGYFDVLDTATRKRCTVLNSPGHRIALVPITCEKVSALDVESGRELSLNWGVVGQFSVLSSTTDGRWLFRNGSVLLRRDVVWGTASFPEFWIALLSGGALMVIAARNLRRRFAKPKAAQPVQPEAPR